MENAIPAVQDYISSVAPDRKEAIEKLFETISANIPEGFQAEISYKMIGWVVPHSLYPAGYHCSPELPLPFISLAAQKNFFALYHMGIYADAELLEWFVAEYPKHSSRKLDMGKSCIRFKKMEDIPYDLIAVLCQKINVKKWISMYETAFVKK